MGSRTQPGKQEVYLWAVLLISIVFFLKFVVDLVNGKMLLYLMQLHDLHQFIVCREQLNFNSCWSYSYSWLCLVLFFFILWQPVHCVLLLLLLRVLQVQPRPWVPLITANWSYFLPSHEDLRSIGETNLLCPILLWFIILVMAQMVEYFNQ